LREFRMVQDLISFFQSMVSGCPTILEGHGRGLLQSGKLLGSASPDAHLNDAVCGNSPLRKSACVTQPERL